MAFLINVLGSEADALSADEKAQLAAWIHVYLETETGASPDTAEVEGADRTADDMKTIVDDVMAGDTDPDIELPVQSHHVIHLSLREYDLVDVHELFQAVWPGRSADGLSRAVS